MEWKVESYGIPFGDDLKRYEIGDIRYKIGKKLSS